MSSESPGSTEYHLSRAIDALDRKVEGGFSRVERRMDDMVTRSTFESTVARLDQKDAHLEDQISSGFRGVREDMAAGARKTRWLVGVVVAGAGVLSAVAGVVIDLFVR